jgi:putative SOS response-associated peptidase YedK
MCGRFTLAADPSELGDEFEGFEFPKGFAPRYNISPSQPVLAIRNDGKRQADFLVWGLVPSWAKDASIGSRLINARGETLAEKPAFRGAYKYKRCLIPADGFYEWKAEPGKKIKTPYAIRMKSGRPFAFAGLWDEWHSPDGSVLYSCTIITTAPNQLTAPIHNRMPVILRRHDYTEWLDPLPRPAESLSGLIRPFPAELLDAYPVSTLVNSPANDAPECIQPA